MKLFYETFILAFLIFYSALSIAILGAWMYRKARSLMAAGRSSCKQHGQGWGSGEGEIERRKRLCEASLV